MHPTEPGAPQRDPAAIIVVTYNSRAYFARLNAALAAQTHPFRLLVIDNASQPAQRPTAADFPVAEEVLQMDENTGFAAANNAGVARTGAALVALLNPDAFPAPNWLERLVAAAAAAPDAGSIGSTQISAENTAEYDGLGDCYHVIGIPWRGGFGWPTTAPAPAGDPFSACAAAALYRRAAWMEVGGFDTSYFCYCEDVDLGFRLRLAGWRVTQATDAVVHHVGGASSGPKSDFATYHGTRNRLWTFVKNMPGPAFWALAPVHAAATVWLLARARSNGTYRATSRGLWDGLKGLGPVWAARGQVQRGRRASMRAVLGAMTWSLRPMRTRAPVLK